MPRRCIWVRTIKDLLEISRFLFGGDTLHCLLLKGVYAARACQQLLAVPSPCQTYPTSQSRLQTQTGAFGYGDTKDPRDIGYQSQAIPIQISTSHGLNCFWRQPYLKSYEGQNHFKLLAKYITCIFRREETLKYYISFLLTQNLLHGVLLFSHDHSG